MGGGDDKAVLATAKTEDMAVYMAVRGWGGGSATQEGEIVSVLAVAVITAKTGDGDVDIATRESKIFVVLAVTVITAKIGGLLAKNVVKRGDSGDKDVENNPSWSSLI